MYMQFSCNTNYNRFFVIQYQIKDKLPPEKALKRRSCKRETVRSTERIVNPF